MLIKGYSLQEETVFEIGKFTILWNWFECSWCHNNCNPRKIKQIATRIHIDEEKQAHLAEVLNERRNWFGQLEAEYVRDSLHPDNARASKEEDMDVMRQFITQSEGELSESPRLSFSSVSQCFFPLISVPAGKGNRCLSPKKKSALSCKKRRTGGLYIRKKCESPPVFSSIKNF